MKSKRKKIPSLSFKIHELILLLSLCYVAIPARFTEIKKEYEPYIIGGIGIIYIFCILSFCWYMITQNKKEWKNKGVMWFLMGVDIWIIGNILYYFLKEIS